MKLEEWLVLLSKQLRGSTASEALDKAAIELSEAKKIILDLLEDDEPTTWRVARLFIERETDSVF